MELPPIPATRTALSYTFSQSKDDADSAIEPEPYAVRVPLMDILWELNRDIWSIEQKIASGEYPPVYHKLWNRELIEIRTVQQWLLDEDRKGLGTIIWNPKLPALVGRKISGALSARRFLSIECTGCRCCYAKEDISFTDWATRDPSGNLHGGKQAVCPAGHVLAKLVAWMS